MSMNPVIQTDRLTRCFGDKTAVDGLNLQVQPGEVFGFLGHNGAGKTTTVRLLNGVLSPTSGSASVLGFSPAVDGAALRRRTGVLTESPSLDERLTARQNLEIYAALYGVPEGEVTRRVAETLTTFDLLDHADEKAGAFSKGMKQRLALARALVHHPEVLFLDEPTSGLDPVAARSVHELIVDQSRKMGHTVFLCTHNLIEAQRLCDRVAVMEHGKLIALGTPAELSRQMAGQLRVEFEIEPAQKADAVKILKNIPAVAVHEEENGSLLVSGIQRSRVPDLVTALAAGGVRIFRVSPQEPTLEDVYFALQGSQEVHA